MKKLTQFFVIIGLIILPIFSFSQSNLQTNSSLSFNESDFIDIPDDVEEINKNIALLNQHKAKLNNEIEGIKFLKNKLEIPNIINDSIRNEITNTAEKILRHIEVIKKSEKVYTSVYSETQSIYRRLPINGYLELPIESRYADGNTQASTINEIVDSYNKEYANILSSTFSLPEFNQLNSVNENTNSNYNEDEFISNIKTFLTKLKSSNINAYNQQYMTLFEKNKKIIRTLDEENKFNLEKIQKLLREHKLKKKESNRDINEWGIKTGLPWFCITVLVLFLSTVLYNKKWTKNNQSDSDNSDNSEHLSKVLIEVITVLLLTLTILILGLSNILKENVLGTLIGGIAGYILNRTKDTIKPNLNKE